MLIEASLRRERVLRLVRSEPTRVASGTSVGEVVRVMAGFNYDFCKGCGICALECPGKKGVKAIEMHEEGK